MSGKRAGGEGAQSPSDDAQEPATSRARIFVDDGGVAVEEAYSVALTGAGRRSGNGQHGHGSDRQSEEGAGEEEGLEYVRGFVQKRVEAGVGLGSVLAEFGIPLQDVDHQVTSVEEVCVCVNVWV